MSCDKETYKVLMQMRDVVITETRLDALESMMLDAMADARDVDALTGSELHTTLAECVGRLTMARTPLRRWWDGMTSPGMMEAAEELFELIGEMETEDGGARDDNGGVE